MIMYIMYIHIYVCVYVYIYIYDTLMMRDITWLPSSYDS